MSSLHIVLLLLFIHPLASNDAYTSSSPENISIMLYVYTKGHVFGKVITDWMVRSSAFLHVKVVSSHSHAGSLLIDWLLVLICDIHYCYMCKGWLKPNDWLCGMKGRTKVKSWISCKHSRVGFIFSFFVFFLSDCVWSRSNTLVLK